MADRITDAASDRLERDTKKMTFGHVQLRDHETNEIILVPTPSNDPNDPLNWSVSRSGCLGSHSPYGQVTAIQALHRGR